MVKGIDLTYFANTTGEWIFYFQKEKEHVTIFEMRIPPVTNNAARSIPLPKVQNLGAVEQIVHKSIGVTQRSTTVLVTFLAGASLLAIGAAVYVFWRRSQSEDKPPQEPKKHNQSSQSPISNQVTEESPEQKKKSVDEPVSERHLKMANQIFPNYASEEMPRFLQSRGIKSEKDVQALWDLLDILIKSANEEMKKIKEDFQKILSQKKSGNWDNSYTIGPDCYTFYQKYPFLFTCSIEDAVDWKEYPHFFPNPFEHFPTEGELWRKNARKPWDNHEFMSKFFENKCLCFEKALIKEEAQKRALKIYLQQIWSVSFWHSTGDICLAGCLLKYPEFNPWKL